MIPLFSGSNSCPGLSCQYACNNDTGAAPACICKTGYKLVNIENCTGKMLCLYSINKMLVSQIDLILVTFEINLLLRFQQIWKK